MIDIGKAGSFKLGDRIVKRHGLRRHAARRTGRVRPAEGPRRGASPCCAKRSASGVNHIDTSDFYGPHVTNQLIREALHPYPDDLVIVTKIGARRGEDASWIPAISPDELTQRGPRQSAQPRARRAGRRQPADHGQAFMGRPKDRSRSRSPRWPTFSARAWCVTSGSATSPPPKSRKGGGSATSSACRTTIMWPIGGTTL